MYVAGVCTMHKKLKSVRFHTEYGLGRQEIQYLPNHFVCGARSFAHGLKLDSISIIWIIFLPKCFMHKLVTPRTPLSQKELQKNTFCVMFRNI